MTLLVQKFGGSSVADVAGLQRVAKIIASAIQKGHQVVAVVSAMGKETDRLIQLADEIATTGCDREYASLLATGEQVSASLLAMALQSLGVPAQSLQAFQLPIKTTDDYRQAYIEEIELASIRERLQHQIVPVVTGFQGIRSNQDITTLGRGGSDVTAVALAAYLQADECQIYTDVEGVYTADPHVVECARLIPRLSYDEMLTFAELGAKVLQNRSVELARKYQLPLRVLSSFTPAMGTLLRPLQYQASEPIVSGVACIQAQCQLVLPATPTREQLDALDDAGIPYDMQHHAMLVIPLHDRQRLPASITPVHTTEHLAMISLVGVGMEHHAGLAATLFQELSQADVAILAISSTPFRVTILIQEQYVVTSMNLLHHALKLDVVPSEDSVG